jgi:hypothetical protein
MSSDVAFMLAFQVFMCCLKEKNIHFESLEMRKQNSCSQSVKYDVQSLADFRNLIISNKDVFSALLSSFTRRVASQDEALQRSTLLDKLSKVLLPIIELPRAKCGLSNVGVVTCNQALWEGGGERRKFAMIAETTLELIQHGYITRDLIGLIPEEKFVNSSWSVSPVSSIYKDHFAAFFDDASIAAVDEGAEETDHERAFERRQRLRKSVPDIFKASSLDTCDLRVIMVLEVLLKMDRFDGNIKEDAASVTHIRSELYRGFSNTGVMIPLTVVGGVLQEGAIDDEALLYFTCEADVRFNKNY